MSGARLGLAITTIGRPALARLLTSAAASTAPPVAVAVANQSGAPLPAPPAGLPFPVVVIESSGGASTGRNDAVRALGGAVDVLAFPNDDSWYPPETLAGVVDAFSGSRAPAAVAVTLLDPHGPRLTLPAAGTALDLRTVWRAVEPATFVTSEAFGAAGGFDVLLGTGAGTPWGSGEGTDLLLTLIKQGHALLSRPDLVVQSAGEKRALTGRELMAKHRAYARGTGFVYRRHGYPVSAYARILIGPLARPLAHDPSPALSLGMAAARVIGRVEGLRGEAGGRRAAWRPPAREAT